MANNSALKQDIRDYIYTNHNEGITGNILRDVLLAMVDTLGDGWTYKGVATTTTNPGTPDDNVFYIATAPGTYTNFGGLSVADGEVAILKYNGSWAKDVTGAATKAQLNQLGRKVDELAQGKFYGYFSDADELPAGDVPGFAYVGTAAPFAIYNFDGSDWSDSGLTIDEIPIGNGEDIDTNEDGKLQFSDRVNGVNTSGMNYVILRKNKTFAEQVVSTNTIYEIRDEFSLVANFSLPQSCILKFNGGKILGGGFNLSLSSNSGIFGEGGLLVNTRLVIQGSAGNPVKKVFVKDVTLDANKNKYLENVVYGEYAEKVSIENVIVKDYYHNYTSGEEHSQYSVIYLSHFTNLSISHLQAKNGVYPNGLMIVWSDNVTISNCVIDDTNNESGIAYPSSTGNIWSNLELFYNTNVVVENSYIKARTSSGSLINCGCKDIVFRDCVMQGGNSVDVGDEWAQDATFTPGNVTIDNCTILDGTNGVKSLVNPNGLDGLCVKNCRIKLNNTSETNKSVFQVQNVKDFSAINNTMDALGYNLMLIVSYTQTARDLGLYILQGNIVDNIKYGILSADHASTLKVFVLDSIFRVNSNMSAFVEGRNVANFSYFVKNNQIICSGYFCAFHPAVTNLSCKSVWVGNYIYSGDNTINDAYRSIRMDVDQQECLIHDNYFSGVSVVIKNTTAKKSIRGNFFERDGRIYIYNCDNAIIEGNILGTQYIRNESSSVMGSNMLIRDNICKYSFFNKYIVGNNAENLIGVKAFGTTAQRPTNKIDGFQYYDTDLKRVITWNGSAWVDVYGETANIKRKGTTAERQTAAYAGAGSTYFDTDLGKMIVSNGTAWVNMDGSALS